MSRPPPKHPFWKFVDVAGAEDCWAWRRNVDRDGYGIVGRERAHRVAFELAHRTILREGAVVRHSCDRPPCCNPAHLLCGSQLQNVSDRVERGRSAKGVGNGRNVLSENDVLAIYSAKGSLAAVAAARGVSKWTVRDIKTGRIWAWLTGATTPSYSHERPDRSHERPHKGCR